MKKLIKGKVYDTKTAKKIGGTTDAKLYITKEGNYFFVEEDWYDFDSKKIEIKKRWIIRAASKKEGKEYAGWVKRGELLTGNNFNGFNSREDAEIWTGRQNLTVNLPHNIW